MDEQAKREIKDLLISFDRSLIASGVLLLLSVTTRSSSHGAQEVRRPICSCSLPEVLPINAFIHGTMEVVIPIPMFVEQEGISILPPDLIEKTTRGNYLFTEVTSSCSTYQQRIVRMEATTSDRIYSSVHIHALTSI